jgi:hypothetical protein
MVRSLLPRLRRWSAATRRHTTPVSGESTAIPAWTSPGPCDMWWMDRIAYPFMLWFRSTVDSWAATTAWSTASSAAGSKINGSDQPALKSNRVITVSARHFWLKALGLSFFHMPVLPPIQILANRSWILWSSPCLLYLIAPEVPFICFSMVAL